MKPLIGAGGLASRAADPEEELIARLSTLAPALDGEPDPEWESRTRSRLVAMAAVRTPEPEPVPPLRRLLARREGRPALWRTRLTAGLAGAAAAVTAVAAVVTVSADAQPGDALYGIKRGTEQTQLALAGDARGRTLLGFASTRLEELAAVLPDEPSADLVDDLLATMDAQTADGAAWLTERALDTRTEAPLDELAGWSSGQSAGLADVRPAVPSAAADDAGNSADLLTRIDERVDALRSALACPSGPVTDGSDELGPVPGTCTAPAPSVGGSNDPDAPVTDLPGTTAAPTPDSPAEAPGAPGGGTGSGGSDSGSGSDADSGSGSGSDDSDLPDLPVTETPIPIPDLPTLAPLPDSDVLLPGATAGESSGTAEETDDPLDLDVCLEPLPVIGGC